MIYIILFIAYIISLCFYDGKFLQFCCALLSMIILYKYISNNRKCTISYLECKIRNIKKEKSVVFNALNEIYDSNNAKVKYFICLLIIISLLVNLKKIFYD